MHLFIFKWGDWFHIQSHIATFLCLYTSVPDKPNEIIEYPFCDTRNMDAEKFQQYRYYLVFVQVCCKSSLSLFSYFSFNSFESVNAGNNAKSHFCSAPAIYWDRKIGERDEWCNIIMLLIDVMIVLCFQEQNQKKEEKRRNTISHCVVWRLLVRDLMSMLMIWSGELFLLQKKTFYHPWSTKIESY